MPPPTLNSEEPANRYDGGHVRRESTRGDQ